MSRAPDRSPPSDLSVAVVGAGLAGLTVAYRLSRMQDERGRSPSVLVLEASDRIGGSIETIERDGFTIERAADSMITEKTWGLDLCRDLGLQSELLATNAACRRSFIVRGRTLQPVPEGFHLMAPSRLLPFALSPLMSWRGKLRVALEPLVPARRNGSDDESLASFVRRRLGREALERIAQPMVGGIYSADPERLSLRATMPRFIDMERDHGSVVRGLIAARKRAGAGVATASGPRYDLFVSLVRGMRQLPDTLAHAVGPAAIAMRRRVTSVQKSSSGWRLETAQGPIDADGVCLALPAHGAAALLAPLAPAAARELESIAHASTATVTFAFRRADVGHPLDGFGFVVPAVERRTTLACTFNSVKFPPRAPRGFVLMRAFVGGAMFPANFALADDEMTARVETELRELLGLRGKPLWTLVSRYAHAMPQYAVGHLDRVGRIDDAMAAIPTLALAGNAYAGAGIPDTIRSANHAARQLAAALHLTREEECRA